MKWTHTDKEHSDFWWDHKKESEQPIHHNKIYQAQRCYKQS